MAVQLFICEAAARVDVIEAGEIEGTPSEVEVGGEVTEQPPDWLRPANELPTNPLWPKDWLS
jgi:hypothetical protein